MPGLAGSGLEGSKELPRAALMPGGVGGAVLGVRGKPSQFSGQANDGPRRGLAANGRDVKNLLADLGKV